MLLKTPLCLNTVKKLRAGDVVFLDGVVFTARDQATRRLLVKPDAIPKNSVVYHCGPLAKKLGGKWILASAGPTTSSRMNALLPSLVRKCGVRALIGKGGVDVETIKAMKECCVYLAAVGGAGALYARQLKVLGVRWLELGEPEALWMLEARGFGPLIVAIDSRGVSLY
ncbi:MAG: FumA C-terminus/TtdB family hydratase beta subunit [Candidatus Norongarragalinales archaeon]